MPESLRLPEAVQERLERFLDDRTPILSPVGDAAEVLRRYSRDILSGGKRFRASFCHWGWRSVPNTVAHPVPTGYDTVVSVAAALEIFHAAALVHDDIIDRSDTRRGAPSAHRRFAALHTEHGWAGDPERFGLAGAVLLGDLLLGFSDDLLEEALDDRPTPLRRAVRAEYSRMRTQVTAGQYLDVLDENAWPSHRDEEALDRARRVMTFKSAKYSVEAPLALGALLAGASTAQLDALRAYGLPLGIAYQLRDDLLGVFGDARVTGKPSGDDLREGKRTVLVALTRERLPANARRTLDELLGDPGLEPAQVAMVQQTIDDCGARDDVERLIRDHVRQASEALTDAPLDREAVDRLRALASEVAHRDA